MSYSGNPALSQDTQDRIVSTFGQTLDLAREGRRQEAKLGCDFILKMDPLFQPARQLQERLENGEGPVDVSDLQVEAAAAGPEAAGLESEPADELLPGAGRAADPLGGEATEAPSLEGSGVFELPSLDSPPPLDSPPMTLDGGPISPAPPASPPGATGGGSVPETGQRIQELLDEGQAAFESSEYQKAIDAWSRIFLIDIDHQEAARRIELARKLKAELERKLDETFHEGVSEREAGRLDEARAYFEKVLELQPHHLAAKEYLQQLDNPQPEPAPFSAPPVEDLLPELPGADAAAPAAGGAFSDDYDTMLSEESTSVTVPPADLGKGGTAKPQRSSFVLGLLVLVVAAAAGWYLYGRWGSFFPSEEEPPPPPAAPVVDVVQRANRLHLSGETERALEELHKLEPDHPAYGRAQVLIEQWESEPGLAPDPPPVEVSREEEEEPDGRRERLLSRARVAYSEGEYLRAARAFKAADDLSPLEGVAADLFEDTKSQLRPIAQQIDLFRQREWEMVVPVLWRKLKDDPDNKDVARILADSYFNLGIRDLRRGVPADAERQFREAVALRPEDEKSKRLLHFSQAYQQAARDVLYEIYVKQLTYRR